MMQVATTQAARALAALRSSRRRGGARRRRRAGPPRLAGPLVIDRAVRRADAAPRVRHDRVVAARARLRAGVHPSADEVAGMIIRRSLCDHLG